MENKKAVFLSLCNKADPKETDCDRMQVFLHTLFLEYATETGENKCKAVFYTDKQIGMRSLELFWPFDFSQKSRGHSCLRPFISRP